MNHIEDHLLTLRSHVLDTIQYSREDMYLSCRQPNLKRKKNTQNTGNSTAQAFKFKIISYANGEPMSVADASDAYPRNESLAVMQHHLS